MVAAQAHVTILDNLVTGSIDNCASIAKSIEFIEGDIRDKNICYNAVKNKEYVFHLAAQVSVPESQQKPDYCYDVNVTGTQHILDAIQKAGTQATCVFSSSCAVYGNKTEPCLESMPCNPTSVYAYSKLIGELLCQQYSALYSIPTICLRYFNVYGERQNPYGPYAGVYAKFSDAMQQGEPVTIFGDGKQSRDFIAVHKVVEANMHAAQLERQLLQGQALNIGTGKQKTILSIFEELKNKYDYTKNPEFKPARNGDILSSCANIQQYEMMKRIITMR